MKHCTTMRHMDNYSVCIWRQEDDGTSALTNEQEEKDSRCKLCIAPDRHRYTSFFVPDFVSEVRWIDDGFGSLLPFPFNPTLEGLQQLCHLSTVTTRHQIKSNWSHPSETGYSVFMDILIWNCSSESLLLSETIISLVLDSVDPHRPASTINQPRPLYANLLDRV